MAFTLSERGSDITDNAAHGVTWPGSARRALTDAIASVLFTPRTR